MPPTPFQCGLRIHRPRARLRGGRGDRHRWAESAQRLRHTTRGRTGGGGGEGGGPATDHSPGTSGVARTRSFQPAAVLRTKPKPAGTLGPPQSAGRRVTAVGRRPTAVG